MPDGSRVKMTALRAVESVPVRCVQVDNADHLYLAGPTGIPTHNSTLALDLCRAASIHHNMTSVFFSLEMNRSEITMRLLSAEAKVPLNHIRTGQMTDDDWAKLARKMGEVSSAPIFIDDSPNMTMMEIRAKARRLKQTHDLKLIVIDYMQLMSRARRSSRASSRSRSSPATSSSSPRSSRSPSSRCASSTVGRSSARDKRPMMSDLRESGSLEQDADMVILLHREDVYEKESTRPGRPTSSWRSTATVRPATSLSPSRATTPALSTWRTNRLRRPRHSAQIDA